MAVYTKLAALSYVPWSLLGEAPPVPPPHHAHIFCDSFLPQRLVQGHTVTAIWGQLHTTAGQSEKLDAQKVVPDTQHYNT